MLPDMQSVLCKSFAEKGMRLLSTAWCLDTAAHAVYRLQYDGDPRWCDRAFRIPRCVLNRRVKVHDENWWPPSPFGEQRDPFFHCSNWAMARRHKIALTDPRPRIFSPEGAKS